ncbi:hypothetical protein EDD29_4992 [Actinocorallia herbida]|uniref:RING-type E3 ubiquitin transferase n=1 Tax=Actinocorallia herbida TaxID=58109 RepID=A0A3N1D1H5_9ACTN|nr:hypothetical protein [Actinocorallia herbida]ROO87387.1 hypothetical protein EDD29_4992 [Actinocorallia herbida]
MVIPVLASLPLLAAGGFMLWLAAVSLWELLKGPSHRKVECARLPYEDERQGVRLVGRAGPGPDGPLKAPISGRPCVWWSVRSHGEPMSQGSSGDKRPSLPSGHRTSSVPFAVADDSGEALVPIGELTVGGVEHGRERRSSHPDLQRVVLVEREAILEVGALIDVFGRPDHGSPGVQAVLADDLRVGLATGHSAVRSGIGHILLSLVIAAACFGCATLLLSLLWIT